jgi:hypothetical protein
MNLAYNGYAFQQEEPENVDSRRSVEKVGNSRRRTNYSKSHNRPTTHNGIHRRRNKKFNW